MDKGTDESKAIFVFRSWGHNIRIHHECEDEMEKSVPKIAVWHHKACGEITNEDHKGQMFLFRPHTNNRIFFLLTIDFLL